MDLREAIVNVVNDFIKGGDESDVETLDQALHPDFRNVQSGFFEEKGLFIIDKKKYLSLIKNKTFGGIKRDMKVLSLESNGDISFVKVKLESKTMIFHSLITLVNDQGQWKVIGNYPHFQYK